MSSRQTRSKTNGLASASSQALPEPPRGKKRKAHQISGEDEDEGDGEGSVPNGDNPELEPDPPNNDPPGDDDDWESTSDSGLDDEPLDRPEGAPENAPMGDDDDNDPFNEGDVDDDADTDMVEDEGFTDDSAADSDSDEEDKQGVNVRGGMNVDQKRQLLVNALDNLDPEIQTVARELPQKIGKVVKKAKSWIQRHREDRAESVQDLLDRIPKAETMMDDVRTQELEDEL